MIEELAGWRAALSNLLAERALRGLARDAAGDPETAGQCLVCADAMRRLRTRQLEDWRRRGVVGYFEALGQLLGERAADGELGDDREEQHAERLHDIWLALSTEQAAEIERIADEQLEWERQGRGKR